MPYWHPRHTSTIGTLGTQAPINAFRSRAPVVGLRVGIRHRARLRLADVLARGRSAVAPATRAAALPARPDAASNRAVPASTGEVRAGAGRTRQRCGDSRRYVAQYAAG